MSLEATDDDMEAPWGVIELGKQQVVCAVCGGIQTAETDSLELVVPDEQARHFLETQLLLCADLYSSNASLRPAPRVLCNGTAAVRIHRACEAMLKGPVNSTHNRELATLGYGVSDWTRYAGHLPHALTSGLHSHRVQSGGETFLGTTTLGHDDEFPLARNQLVLRSHHDLHREHARV